jgi:hypothetical protein
VRREKPTKSRHHRDRRFAPAWLIEYLDAGGPDPVIPVALLGAGQHQRDRHGGASETGVNSPRSCSLKLLLGE